MYAYDLWHHCTVVAVDDSGIAGLSKLAAAGHNLTYQIGRLGYALQLPNALIKYLTVLLEYFDA